MDDGPALLANPAALVGQHREREPPSVPVQVAADRGAGWYAALAPGIPWVASRPPGGGKAWGPRILPRIKEGPSGEESRDRPRHGQKRRAGPGEVQTPAQFELTLAWESVQRSSQS
jgi:hypothetical protein